MSISRSDSVLKNATNFNSPLVFSEFGTPLGLAVADDGTPKFHIAPNYIEPTYGYFYFSPWPIVFFCLKESSRIAFMHQRVAYALMQVPGTLTGFSMSPA